ncbi:hydrolase 1, exosortase A system-associated [Neptunomonas antarctica]|uniref:Exosortase A system-associated hydrolase 1/exosortase A system-associated hydrolase 2 n=1 Tax=Neptunomonas antarctica TaxID=619304 RepID=A0A1N7JF21_9GAMM|nr:hydrolase 1, exosortase A system-associated [Neptunomonas antarctica]SIS47846.1 exosortase A system-associated hydrolase 1/exosortase A system-associated hydrolase 2 [Neptunomonas antarctica]
MIPQFISGPAGRLFISLYSPIQHVTDEWIIHLPAFAEEMNKSRKMMHDQAAAFSAKGAVVIVPDLYGTGDSEGDFGDASWGVWKQDIRYLVEWAKTRGAQKITLWGNRSGGLMALDLIREGLNDVSHLILWQPVHSGEQLMTQFLRLRMAAGMISGEKETVAQQREQLKTGKMLEVAGYDVGAALLLELDSISLKQMILPVSLRIDWLEVVSSSERPLLPASQKLLALWQSQGIDVHSQTVVGEPFWSTQEITSVPALVHDTALLISPLLMAVDSSAELSPSRLTSSESLSKHEYKQESKSGLLSAPESEHPFVFSCEGEELVGVIHLPVSSASTDIDEDTGVLIIVGGPQYRAGSHRQFVHLARHLAEQNIPVMRFDYRGMGDSSGAFVGFENIGVDIKHAIDSFMERVPTLKGVVLWGLCDAATAACFYAPEDKRVSGLVILNPWVRSEAGEATAFLKHYYLQRFCSKQFWQKVIKGEFNISGSVASLLSMLKRSAGGKAVEADIAADLIKVSEITAISSTNLAEKIESSLGAYRGPVQCIISGNDLTAAEFDDVVKRSKSFTRLLKQKRINREDLKSADHTFSKREWRDKVAAWTVNWIRTL